METVLITGCSSGIGRVTALEFLDRDWTVYATARNRNDVSDLADAGCETAALDVTDDQQVRQVVDRVVEETGRVDCLVNNAGYGQFGPVEDVPVERVHDQFDVNVYGPHRLTRAVLPHMREQGEGTIVTLSSVAGRVASPLAGVYNASKHAIEGMYDALRPEVRSAGVDVVLVEPGPVDTEFGERVESEFQHVERSDAYADLYAIHDDWTLLGSGDGLFAVPPQRVANAVADAASVSDPAPRYPVGRMARLAVLARHLPATWRDAAYGLVRRLLG